MIAARDDDLVLAAFTVHNAGLVERCQAAADAGFDAISLRPADLDRALREGFQFRDIETVLTDHGLRLADLDAVLWWAPHHATSDLDLPRDFPTAERMNQLWRAVEILRPRSVNVVDLTFGPQPLDELVAGFAHLTARAADCGVLAHLEQLSGSAVPDLATAVTIARQVAHPAAGVLIDTWHHFRAGGTVAEVAAARDVIHAIQINDAPPCPAADLRHEAMHHRLLPGEGHFPLVDFLHAVGRTVPIAVEVMSQHQWSRPPDQVAHDAWVALRQLFTEASAATTVE